jgi:hypothetical protein
MPSGAMQLGLALRANRIRCAIDAVCHGHREMLSGATQYLALGWYALCANRIRYASSIFSAAVVDKVRVRTRVSRKCKRRNVVPAW